MPEFSLLNDLTSLLWLFYGQRVKTAQPVGFYMWRRESS